MWEHAFVYDYPTSEKKKYVDAFFENLNWEVIEKNFKNAQYCILSLFLVLLNYMKNFNLQNIVWKEGKYFVAQCLNADVSSFGKTKKEALKNLSEALTLYFEDVKNPKIQEVRSPQIFPTHFQYA